MHGILGFFYTHQMAIALCEAFSKHHFCLNTTNG